ncbi:MAG: ABC transporter substrate-binding protein [Pseudomonadota bacterium]
MATIQTLAERVIAVKPVAMIPTFTRRALMVLAAPLLILAPSACRDQRAGESHVVVIGAQPQLRDPAQTSLNEGDSVLLENVARGLVSFDPSGNIVGGLAERWNVSDDGLSYIFRLTAAKWGNGRKVTAEQVARALKASLGATGNSRLHDALGAVEDVVAMTDRVIEIRLSAPRPNLLNLLAQPEFAIIRRGSGTGPFTLEPNHGEGGALSLTRAILANDDEQERKEHILLKGGKAEQAIADFAGGKTDLVLGGRFADLPLTKRAELARGTLRFDPASGLFGLVPMRRDGPFATAEARALLSRAIDRDAFVAALGVPGLAPRATVLEAGLDGIAAPVAPAWFGTAIADRRAALANDAGFVFGSGERPAVTVYLPTGPGADLLLQRLQVDWGAIGLKVERARSPRESDFALIDEVAPSFSPAWFVRHFRCDSTPVCNPDADTLLDAARAAQIPGQRYALIAQAASLVDSKTLFIPLIAPVRWSLVSTEMTGFRGNRFARHTLSGLQDVRSGRE